MTMDDKIMLSHGGGGRKMDELLAYISERLPAKTGVSILGVGAMDDGAVTELDTNRLVVTTDAHTISPLFFPGGDLGKLTICGALNDCAAMGAKPKLATLALVLEEGLPVETLGKLLDSIRDESEKAGLEIVAGDTKVMPRGAISEMVTVTTVIGELVSDRLITDSGVKPGDAILLTGEVGTHGIALMSMREGLGFETELESDVTSLHNMLLAACDQFDIHAMKDPTRGGLASALNEFSAKSKVTLLIEEKKIAVHPQALAASDMLGLDPLGVSNEGKAIIAVTKDQAEELLGFLQSREEGKNASIIGRALMPDEEKKILDQSGLKTGHTLLKTAVSGTRIMEKPHTEPIPRVC